MAPPVSMRSTVPKPVTVPIDRDQRVSGLLQAPAAARCCYVLAHGAGAGMAHPFMASVADGLAQRGIATLRYQFPYMERGRRRPDPPAVAQAAVRAAIAAATQLLPGVPLFAGGKSFGGRMTSQAQAVAALPGVRGLAFLGFPLHPAGRPADERGRHLLDVHVPMLFLQGDRDALADAALESALRVSLVEQTLASACGVFTEKHYGQNNRMGRSCHFHHRAAGGARLFQTDHTRRLSTSVPRPSLHCLNGSLSFPGALSRCFGAATAFQPELDSQASKPSAVIGRLM